MQLRPLGTIIVILYVFTVAACGKSKPIIPPNTEPESPTFITPDPAQYGTPYNTVPTSNNAVIYQVNMRCFSQQGNLQGVLARLDSIKALGINVIYLMPIYPVGTVRAFNSPYCIKDYKSVGTEFGSLNDLRAITDAAHSKGMAVILDWVANHTSWDQPWLVNRSWYEQNAAGEIIQPPNTTYTDVAQLNFTSTAMKTAMINALKYWVYAANIDGYRFDYADAISISFLQQATNELRSIPNRTLFLFAEGGNNNLFNCTFNVKFGFGYYDNLKKTFANTTTVTALEGISSSEYIGANSTQKVVRYITNHDVHGSEGTPEQIFGNTKAATAAFVLAAYYNGVPMVYNGQEVAQATAITFPFTSVKINWNTNPLITAEYKQLIQLYNTNEVIRNGTITSYSNARVSAYTKNIGLQRMLVLVNSSNATQSINLPTNLSNALWNDAFINQNYTINATTTLQPYEYKVLRGN